MPPFSANTSSTSARHSVRSRGFTLIETMITVAIVGILAALAVYGVRVYLLTAKTAEATHNLGTLGKRAAESYDRDNMSGSYLNALNSAAINKGLCKSAAATIPASSASIKGAKYMSAPAEWQAGDATTGWKCLRFELISPQYYMYGYTSDGTTGFTATADGDLTGSGTTSQYQMVGSVVNSKVLLAPAVLGPIATGGGSTSTCSIAATRSSPGLRAAVLVAAILFALRRRRR